MKNLIRLFAPGALLTLNLFAGAYGQGVGASGDIKGTVTDPNHAAVPNTRILVVARQTGLQRSVFTDSSGEYRVPGLTPTNYDLTAEFRVLKPQLKRASL